MLRFLLWILIFYLAWKIVKMLLAPRMRQSPDKTRGAHQSAPPFEDVEEAKFEDVTPKSSSDSQSSPQN